MNMDRTCRLIKYWLNTLHPPYHTSTLFFLCVVVFETNSSVAIQIPPDKNEQFYNYFAPQYPISRCHIYCLISGILCSGRSEIIHGTVASSQCSGLQVNRCWWKRYSTPIR